MEPLFTLPNGRSVRMEVRADTNDWNVCYSILTEDEYRFDSAKPLTGVAVDVGAHIGAASVALLELNPDLRVVAVEPIPENLALLRQNTERYGERVEIIEGAAGRGPQELHYNYRGPDEFARVHRFIANTHVPEGTEYDSITVPGTTLTELVERYGPISLLKMDCEGCEDGFLSDPAMQQVERIVGEIHSGSAVRPMTEADRRDPGEKPANRRKRVSKRVAK